ncbi:YqhR family membrane protein [Ornithinibacillus contaminans]|uniref:YqhR family membrane protein n=1 Tax=Ornithinibacillus contaminans TaxID=694055 RepID=UPI00064D88FA|nr:YqhR family membrane protein [Ornithinibacillus contaminans]
MLKNKKLEQNKQEDSSSLLGRSLFTGFVGGIVASLFGIFMYYFNFIEVSATSYVIRPWTTAAWTNTWLGDLVTSVLIGLLSIFVALIYYGALKKLNSIWVGIVYGILLWVIVFLILEPIFPNVPSVMEMELTSIISSLCLYILYGTFIGYSISFDYYDSVKLSQEKEDEEVSN